MKQTVLVLDEDVVFCTLVSKILESDRIEVVTTASTAAADSYLEKASPDLVLVNAFLPDRKGSDWIADLRAQGFAGPVLLASAFWHQAGIPEEVVERVGVAHVLHKPLTPEPFRQMVLNLLQGNEVGAEQSDNTPRKVLLAVSDDAETLNRVAAICARQNLVLLNAETATRALIIARQTKPHFAMIDLASLGASGFELCQRLRLLHNPELPVAFFFDQEEQAHFENKVIDDADYLVKPVDNESLEDLIHALPVSDTKTGAHVLIVDDDRIFLNIAATILEGRGFYTTMLQDIPTDPDALDRSLEEIRPDLILLDVELGDTDGFSVCRVIRTLPQWQMIPILFLSGHNDVSTRVNGLRSGGDDYIGKPIVGEELVARIDTFLERRQLLHTYQKAMRQLERNHEHLYTLLNNMPQGVMITNERGRVTFLNDTCRKIVGLDSRQWSNKPWRKAMAFTDEDVLLIEQLWEAVDPSRKIQLNVKSNQGPHYRLELRVGENPSVVGGRVFYFSDVSELVDLRRRLRKEGVRRLEGESPAMNKLRDTIIQVARGNWTVTIEGETGVGKELVARTIHDSSPRVDKPFIAVNCAGLSESLLTSQLFGHKRGAFTGAHSDQPGLFRAAHKGSLFLDEFGEIPPSVQTSLLRVLQEGEITPLGEVRPVKVDVRVIVATNRDLANEVASGRFREDLYYRVRVARIQVPPLRERMSDVPLLVSYFLNSQLDGQGISVSTEAMSQMMNYDWPGNVRELQNAVQFSLIHSNGQSVILPEHLPPEVIHGVVKPPSIPMDMPREAVDERSRIIAALQAARGNRSKAARLLGIGRATLYRKLAGLNIS